MSNGCICCTQPCSGIQQKNNNRGKSPNLEKTWKTRFFEIWQLGGSRWVQNTHTSGASILPTRQASFWEKKIELVFGCPSTRRFFLGGHPPPQPPPTSRPDLQKVVLLASIWVTFQGGRRTTFWRPEADLLGGSGGRMPPQDKQYILFSRPAELS